MRKLVDTRNQATPPELDLRVGAEITIGREETCDVRIGSEIVSRRHATVSVSDNKLVVQDNNSRNGIRLDGKPIKREEWTSNQVLEIGPARFVVEQGFGQKTTVVNRPPDQSRRPDGPTASAERTRPTRQNFLLGHWRGDHGLVRSYLVNILLVGIIYLLALSIVISYAAESLTPLQALLLLATNTVITLSVFVWQCVGVTRSLTKAKARGAPTAARVFGWVLVLLPIAIAILALLAWYGTWLRLSEPATANGNPVYTLAQRDNTLVFQGRVVWPIIRDFRARLQADPQINTLVLSSPGGDVIAARRVNDLLRQRSMTTVVADFCHSACTIMYAAGKRRFATTQAKIGFHATSLILMDEMMTRIMNALTLRNDHQNANYYLAAGFDPEFVKRAIATPSTDLLVLPPAELRKLGVVTEIVRR